MLLLTQSKLYLIQKIERKWHCPHKTDVGLIRRYRKSLLALHLRVVNKYVIHEPGWRDVSLCVCWCVWERIHSPGVCHGPLCPETLLVRRGRDPDLQTWPWGNRLTYECCNPALFLKSQSPAPDKLESLSKPQSQEHLGGPQHLTAEAGSPNTSVSRKSDWRNHRET